MCLALENGTAIATSLGGLRDLSSRMVAQDAGLLPRHALWQVRTVASRCAANDTRTGSVSTCASPVGGEFRVGWRSTNASVADEQCATVEPYASMTSRSLCEVYAGLRYNLSAPRTRYTRWLNHAAEATELAAALMEDLGTGDVTVVRSFASGSLEVQWNITLKDADAYDVLPPLSVDGSRLVNDGVSAVAEELRPMPKRLRGVGHLFTRESSTFVEQALLRPYTAQRQDAFGFGCALDGDMGAVGAPNTDSVESGVNSGAAYAYELTFASTGFANATYAVPEGDAVALRVGRRDGEGFARTIAPGRNLILFVWTFSRNADVTQQEWLRDLYGLHDDRMLAPGSTPAEFLGAGAAHGRASWYGGPSNSSQWVDGAKDDLAASDYVPIGQGRGIIKLKDGDYFVPMSFKLYNEITLQTTDDQLYEKPDEDVVVGVWLPGMFPSPLGALRTVVTILDDGDGVDDSDASTYEHLGEGETFGTAGFGSARPPSDVPEVGRGAGFAVAAYNDTQGGSLVTEDPKVQEAVAVLGAPKHNGSRGLALVYRRVGGAWALEQTLTPYDTRNDTAGLLPAASPDEFGCAVAGAVVHGRPLAATVLVSAPGAPAVYAFQRVNVTRAVPEYLLDARYDVNGTLLNYTRVNATAATYAWTLEATLTAAAATRRSHNFGGRGALAVDGDVAVVGASGLECVYVFRRTWDGAAFAWNGAPELVRSLDYDYDVLLGGTWTRVHEQGFGTAVALSGNTLVVGAPFADYGNKGSPDDVETYDTDGLDNRRLGRGKAYAFYSVPPQAIVTVRADSVLFNGTWRLEVDDFRNASCKTAELAYGATAVELRDALDDACSPGGAVAGGLGIEVSRSELAPTASGGERRSWTVTFLGEPDAAPPIKAAWRGYGCGVCDLFNDGWAQAPDRQVIVDFSTDDGVVYDRGGMDQAAALQPDDRSSGSWFGYAVAAHGDAVVVGAPHAAGAAMTTWDFETGDLSGWRATGDAFDDQPTFGDGPSYRENMEYPVGNDGTGSGGGPPQAARLRGRYFVGTLDDRQGARASQGSYLVADDYAGAAGTRGSDDATGTLTSEPVLVPVASGVVSDGAPLAVSFLVGGGCDPLTEYVELLIDGAAVARATGACDERMHNRSFDLSAYEGRSATLRVVDASKSRWGHVNVDHFRFSWPARGFGVGALAGPAATTAADEAAVAAEVAGMNSLYAVGGGRAGETARAGAAYAFRRKSGSDPLAACRGDKEDCAWEYMDKLLPSDRRAGDGFGYAVAVDDDAGVALVGAPNADATTRWKLPPPLRPVGRAPARYEPTDWVWYQSEYATAFESDYLDRASPVRLPMDRDDREHNSRKLRNLGDGRTRNPSGAGAVWAQRARDVFVDEVERPHPHPSVDEARDAGALYVFDREDEDVDVYGVTHQCPRWGGLEVAKLAGTVSPFARQHLGAAAAVAGRALVAGAPEDDAFGEGAGAAVVLDRDAARVSFAQAEFSVVEGFEYATVMVSRDALYAERPVTVAYSTEDLTAKGVDDGGYLKCSGGAPNSAASSGCGDYRQTSGVVTIPKGATTAVFYVFIVDDPCYEPTEYVQLSLSAPGAPTLQGEGFLAKLRIDDDDWRTASSTVYCPDSGFL
mmetsp:Transcript_31945/g.108459  ORF Transcript_31945/g.108459 Transcript_31945/m.108459 type:complete len:1614 (+) Transcript_31945:44-4885(+)